MDSENKAALQATIDAMLRNKAITMIDHWQKTIQNANQILILDSGYIVQQGTHKAD